ncbi:hypothetical protein ACI01nite_22330 [Acetobacter cibinongensis]|uniref:Alginate export domain-containing protein n=1 Tax=Acetobacter cibinongensis TaxID=146475 RepID=A0A0D6N6B3_9PROT|nr:hypothetical protein [Acetobacter cibinongensis]GAN61499.1 hypothetical protein Abci_025_044 [Acetobacter cibinongensis]GEL59631.1 hypothetical protein ACI01nite_22330 [Acetobacter cibinongensis]
MLRYNFFCILLLSMFSEIYVSNSIYADQNIFSYNNFSIKGALEVGGAGFYLPDTNFGVGSYSHSKTRYKSDKNTSFGELYGKPILTARWRTPLGYTVFAEASAVGSTELGHGDAEVISQTSGTPRMVTLEDLHGGVEIPVQFSQQEGNIIVDGGRQKFVIDDGFLIGRGAYSSGNRGVWWYASRYAFAGPGTIRFEGKSIRSDIFMLESDSDNDANRQFDRPKTKFAGFDVSWFRSKKGGHGGADYGDRSAYVTLTYFHVLESDTSSHYDYNTRGNRTGENVLSLSWGGNIIPIKKYNISKDVTFYGNFVGEKSNHSGNGYQSVEAYGFYVEPGYTFSKLPWSPHIFYRYTKFSGNKDQKSKVKRNYDPFFLMDGKRAFYGGYWPGEVELYLVSLSNLIIHQFDITAVTPLHLFSKTDQLKIGAHFYDLSFVHASGLGYHSPSGNHISDEVDFTTEYALDSQTSGALVGGVAWAGPAQRAILAGSVPAGESVSRVHNASGIIEAFFYKRF